jgi:tRNA(Ile2) C34 agmatinyltransferase TiaS
MFRREGRERVGVDAVMCDKLRGGTMEQKPRSAWELLMEKQRLHPTKTIWFTEEVCPKCGGAIYTDGKIKWCSPDCRVPGTYAALQEDHIR